MMSSLVDPSCKGCRKGRQGGALVDLADLEGGEGLHEAGAIVAPGALLQLQELGIPGPSHMGRGGDCRIVRERRSGEGRTRDPVVELLELSWAPMEPREGARCEKGGLPGVRAP